MTLDILRTAEQPLSTRECAEAFASRHQMPADHPDMLTSSNRLSATLNALEKNWLVRHVKNADYGPPRTLYNRFIRWSRLGVFDRIFAELAGQRPKPERIMIDATHLMAHRTAASLLKKGMFPVASGEPRAI
jgi:hypothetical protein